jgi:hypothetical protein
MNKFFSVFVILCLIGASSSKNLRVSYSGDLHPAHRRLSEEGQLNLKIDGRGYFQYRLRVKETDASADGSQTGNTGYDGGYVANICRAPSSTKVLAATAEATCNAVTVAATCLTTDSSAAVAAVALSAASTAVGVLTVTANGANFAIGDSVSLASCTVSASNGDYLVSAAAATSITITDTDGVALSALATDHSSCTVARAVGAKCDAQPVDNAAASAGSADGGSEAAADGDSVNFSQTVYSRDGSLHVNKYGYLVDDNGLLLISAGVGSDANSKFHIHVPSRAEGVLVTPSGKILAEELGGSAFTNIGQIKLARFENPQGLNIRLSMKSNCAAANEDGFALGNWCAGGDLDGKDHTYLAETAVSGAGILGSPGDQGFGRIVQ